MPSAGRRPKPTVVKIAAGNPGRRPLPKNEPQPDGVESGFAPPLHSAAMDVWNEVAPPMIAAGVLRSTDVLMAQILCEQVALYRKAHNSVRKAGGFTSRKTGQVAPALTAMNKALQAIRSLAVEFGMTPSARTRLAVVPAGKAEDDEDAFFKAFA